MSSELRAPDYQELVALVARWNRIAWSIVVLELFGCILLMLIIDWPKIMAMPVMATVAIGVMVGPMVGSQIMWFAQKKTRIQDLRESTRFGIYDKHKLASLYRDTLTRLQITDNHLPLYIVADRTFNASAMHIGMGSLFSWLNGITLNRQVLHQLEPDEVKDIIGHELGHYFQHYLVTNRFHFLSLILGSLLALLTMQWTGFAGWSWITLMVIPGAIWYMVNLPQARCSQAIEYLCDATGAQVSGIIPSIQGLLKIGRANEIESTILYQSTLSKAAGTLNPTQLVETVLNSIPYGFESREEVTAAVERSLKQKAIEQRPSFSGLLRYMWNSDRDEEAQEELESIAKKHLSLQNAPRLDWESILPSPNQVRLDEMTLSKLITFILSNPNTPMFRTMSEVSPFDEDSQITHPPLRNRILFLWQNRAEIESVRRS